MKTAAIDIGTNSVRILIVNNTTDSNFDVLANQLIITRIGENMGPEKELKKNPLERTVNALLKYQMICRDFQVDQVIVAATSAVRDAVNKKIFIARVKRELNWEVRVLTGPEEALLSYRGAIKGLSLSLDKPVVIDIGGGSTEFIWDANGLECLSVNAGAVRMTEGGHTTEEMDIILKPAIEQVISYNPVTIIGVGGTVTTLAAMDQGLMVYDQQKVHGYPLKIIKVNEMLNKLKKMSLTEKMQIPGLQKERADIIVAGITILKQIMDKLRLSEIIVSETDILYGLIYEEVSKS